MRPEDIDLLRSASAPSSPRTGGSPSPPCRGRAPRPTATRPRCGPCPPTARPRDASPRVRPTARRRCQPDGAVRRVPARPGEGCAPAGGDSRLDGGEPRRAHRPQDRRRRAAVEPGRHPARLQRARARAGPLRHRRGGRPGRRAAAAGDHQLPTRSTGSATPATGASTCSCSTSRRARRRRRPGGRPAGAPADAAPGHRRRPGRRGAGLEPGRALLAFVSDRHEGNEPRPAVRDLPRVAPRAARCTRWRSATSRSTRSSGSGPPRWWPWRATSAPEGLAFVGSTPGLFRFDLPADLPVRSSGVRLTDLDTDLGEPGSRAGRRRRPRAAQRPRAAARCGLVAVAVDASAGHGARGARRRPRLVRGAAATPDGSTVALVVTSPERSGDLAVLEATDVRLLTDLSAPVRADGRVRPLHERVATSPDGYPVHGWVVLPDPAARRRPVPGAAEHPRRPVHAVRLGAVRRGPGLRRRRLRRGAVQPAGLGGLRPRPRPGGQGRLRRRATPTTCSRSSTTCWRTTPAPRRRARRRDGRLVRRLHDGAADHPHGPVRRRDRRARLPRPARRFVGLVRHRLVLPVGSTTATVEAMRRRQCADDARRPGDHADPGDPLRGRLALPGRPGPALVRRAASPAASSPSCCCSPARATS